MAPGAGDPGQVLAMEHGELVLRLDRQLNARIYARRSGKLLQLSAASPVPLVALQVDGKRWESFTVSGAPLVRDGIPRWHTLEATASRGSQSVRLLLHLKAHADMPGTLVVQMKVQNTGKAPLTIERVLFNRLRLDLRQQTWAFVGAALDWGKDTVFVLKPGYRGRNPMAARQDIGGGGIPVNVLWTRQGGVSLGHIDPRARAVQMPLETDDKKRATAWIESAGRRLGPGESLSTLPGFLAVHQGDFYEPLARYRLMLARQKQLMPRSPASAYEPVWCSWGYEFDVRPEEILGVAPKLKELGIPWAVLDDRWFDTYGDWRPRTEIFGSDGGKLTQMVRGLHQQGLRAKLWWIPLVVEHRGGRYESHPYRDARVLTRNPTWRILDRAGKPAKGPRGLHFLCPALPAVQQYHRALTERFIKQWDFDGHKLDVVFAVPPCHNPAHGHGRPEESSEAMAEVYKIIFSVTRQLKPHGVTEICPCGTTPHHAWLPYMNQAVTADPVGAVQVRRRIKLLKALMGPSFAVYADHVELTEMHADERETGSDFASAIGTGAVVGTKFVWPRPTRKLQSIKDRLLTPERERLWKQGLALYNRKMLSRGTYLNLYDLAFHRPEAHVVRAQNGRLHYAFFTPKANETFEGQVTFRGPIRGEATVHDYVNNKDLGTVSELRRGLRLRFTGSLLVELIPKR